MMMMEPSKAQGLRELFPSATPPPPPLSSPFQGYDYWKMAVNHQIFFFLTAAASVRLLIY